MGQAQDAAFELAAAGQLIAIRGDVGFRLEFKRAAAGAGHRECRATASVDQLGIGGDATDHQFAAADALRPQRGVDIRLAVDEHDIGIQHACADENRRIAVEAGIFGLEIGANQLPVTARTENHIAVDAATADREPSGQTLGGRPDRPGRQRVGYQQAIDPDRGILTRCGHDHAIAAERPQCRSTGCDIGETGGRRGKLQADRRQTECGQRTV